ncbi:unnamed protein product [Microthlaspi erraticum]|uniref:Uncharacterized protein n=1 Tax=Microthlaspi erraticum TaxID=1685480 RepID=A0A6D2HM49_9BRAS|nr:unnamed protein product [Microthlaspi erraticum]
MLEESETSGRRNIHNDFLLDIGSDFGSSSDIAKNIVQFSPTPENNLVPVQIAREDFDSGSSCKDDESVQTDLRISEESVALLYKISQSLTRIVKISPSSSLSIVGLLKLLFAVLQRKRRRDCFEGIPSTK